MAQNISLIFIDYLLFSITTLTCAFSINSTIFIILRFLSGIGSAMAFGTSMAILTSVFPANERGKALGINTSVVYFALASDPFFGGILTKHFGWQSIFIVCAIIGFIIVICPPFILKGEWIESKNEKFDVIDSVIYAVRLFGLIFGFSKLSDLSGLIWIGTEIIAFIGFIIYEKKCTFPVFNVNIFSNNKIFNLSSLSALINYASTMDVGFMISLYLQYVNGFDAYHAGLILIVQACIQSVVSLFSGKLSDKISPSILASVGMAIISVGLFLLIFITPDTSLNFIVQCFSR